MKRILLPAAIVFFAVGCVAGVVLQWRLGLLSSVAPMPAAGSDEREREGQMHSDEQVVELSEAQIAELGVTLAPAGAGQLQHTIALSGEIAVNADRLAHLVTRVPGVAKDVRKTLGDRVTAGEVMAVVESRELADAKAAYLAARRKLELSEASFRREESLWAKKVSSEQEYLDARQTLAETQIELHTAAQKLHALGFSKEYVEKLPELPDAALTRYEIVAPFDATVIGKHITLGEALKDDAEVFVIADLSTVWVQLNVHQRDLASVREGQEVQVSFGPGAPAATGQISYIDPIVAEQTRTALARVVLPNADGRYRPGLFVNAEIVTEIVPVAVLVARQAVQMLEDRQAVFVRTEHGFEPQFVTVGRSSGDAIEIVGGLAAGEAYVTHGAFELKAALVTAGLGSHAGHGH
ncbi:MAG: efflux RND transporter periplasmic adaptor subunit [Phycisphaerae bacterium]|nr:efflux RND transporter periplasmic adaptor subunit [Phycisphaerae bacterium]